MKSFSDKGRVLFDLISLSFIGVPLLGRMPWWAGAMFALLVLWHGATRLTGKNPPSPPVRFAFLFAAMAGSLIYYGSLVRWDAVMLLSVILTAAFFMSPEHSRGRFLLAIMTSILTLGYSVFQRQEFMTHVYVLTGGTITITHLISALFLQMPILSTLKISGRILFHSIPALLLLVMSMPQIGYYLSRGKSWRIGFTDVLNPRGIQHLASNRAAAFRVTFPQGDRINPEDLYWRGVTLWDTDGWAWDNFSTPPEEIINPGLYKKAKPQRIKLVPHRQNIVFALDAPASIVALGDTEYKISGTTGQDFRSDRKIYDTIEYDAYSIMVHKWPFTANSYGESKQVLDAETRMRATALPVNITGQARELADQWRRESQGQIEIVAKGLEYFGTDEFYYTLAPGMPSQNLDDFIFKIKHGFCGHYASAFAVLMRIAGIPSRVVMGYQGGIYNSLGNYWLIEQRHAHAWTEVWIDKTGWVRVDPTSVVAPERVQTGKTWQELVGESEFADTLHKMYLLFDGIGFSADVFFSSQKDWLGEFATTDFWGQWGDLEFYAWIGVSLALAALVIIIYLAWRKLGIKDHQYDSQNFYSERVFNLFLGFCNYLARHGIRKRPQEGVRTFSARLNLILEEGNAEAEEFLQQYENIRYGGVKVGTAEYRLIKRLYASAKKRIRVRTS